MQSSLSRQLIARLAQAAGQPGGGGQPSDQATPDATGAQLGAQFSQLAGADPNMMLKAAQQVKAMMVAIFGRTAFSMPEAARHAGQANKSIDAMIKSLQEGAAAQMATAPIANSAALPNPSDMGGMGGQDQGMGL